MIKNLNMTSAQQQLIDLPIEDSIFIKGPAGSGKTTGAISRIYKLLTHFRGDQLLILVPQRSLGLPYQRTFDSDRTIKGSIPTLITIGGLARRMADLFWPLVAKEAGFKHPTLHPHFLSIETAQYCLEKVITPYLEKGFFRSVSIEKNRLLVQILDDLNKSAIVQFPLTEISNRLKNTSSLTPELSIAYDQVQVCALAFRTYCLENNLLDYSLLIELLVNHIWPKAECRDYFHRTWHALIADNVEEDVAAAHDLIKQWIPNLRSSLVIFDESGGYRQFLGADPISAQTIAPICRQTIIFDQPILQSEPIHKLEEELSSCILHSKPIHPSLDFHQVLEVHDYHFYPEMVQNICAQVRGLILDMGYSPSDVAILSPYLSDALNFSLETELADMNIPIRSSRPSRKYLSHPAVRAMLTFAKFMHPHWELPISKFELRAALMVAIPDLDIVRAELIVQTLFSDKKSTEGLRSFDTLTNPAMQERITFLIGEKIETIRSWQQAYQASPILPLDVFISMLYGELLSQKGFGFYADFQTADVITKLVLSMRNFRHFAWSFLGIDEIASGLEYLRAVQNGLLPSSILNDTEPDSIAVQISPAHTFLMENRRVRVQFWLDIGSMGWWERLYQPLANPYLLNRNIDLTQRWTEAHEFNANQEAMKRIVAGLLNRCNEKVIVSSVRINEYGSESRGPLLRAFQTLRKRVYLASKESDV